LHLAAPIIQEIMLMSFNPITLALGVALVAILGSPEIALLVLIGGFLLGIFGVFK
jgi:hypothetical protein